MPSLLVILCTLYISDCLVPWSFHLSVILTEGKDLRAKRSAVETPYVSASRTGFAEGCFASQQHDGNGGISMKHPAYKQVTNSRWHER